MFNFRHPRPVVDGRAVAVQVVQQKAASARTPVLVAEHRPPAKARAPASTGEEAPAENP